MNITHIVIIVDHHYRVTNNLEKDVFEYAKSIDRKIFDHDQLQVVKDKIQAKIEELNLKNKRCKPLKVSFSNGHPVKEDTIVHGLNTVYTPLIHIKVVTKSHISTL